MPRKSTPPKYRHHKARNLAVVTIKGVDHYLGPFGSAESHEEYARLIAVWKPATSSSPPLPPATPQSALTVSELILRYWEFAKGYYAKDGKPTKELACMRDALRPLRDLYGHSPAAEFGPLALKTVREHMVSVQKLSRTVVNNRVNRIKRFFKWAVSEELVSSGISEGLRTVAGLRYGRSTARETEPVQPVSDVDVQALIPFLSPTISAMVRVQRLTGMRSCELVLMRPADIDRSEAVWVFTPGEHKNKWRGQTRRVPLGPKVQEILAPFMSRDSHKFLFSPEESEAWRRDQQVAHRRPDRKTPVYPSELRARERRKQAASRRTRKRPLSESYNTVSYRRALHYALGKARRTGVDIPHWFPHQLRHSRATEVRKLHGIEAAQVALGHARADTTQIYAEKNFDLALQIASENG